LPDNTVIRSINGMAVVTTRSADPGPPISVSSSNNPDLVISMDNLYTVNRDRLETASKVANKINRWELGFSDHRCISLKLNGAKLNVKSVNLSSESGSLMTLDLKVLIVPGSDTIQLVTSDGDVVSDNKYYPGNMVTTENVRYIEL
jgi:hypothetical protein